MNVRSGILAATVAAVLTLGAALTAGAQETKIEAPPLQYAGFGDFKLQNGQTIHDFRLAYRTAGTLNAEKSNAIFWPTWLGGKSEDLAGFIGPGNVADTGKYFVVTIDAIGNGVSSSPSNSKSQPRLSFPNFTIRDMVESEHRLATETFGIKHLHAVMGISMGGMQTFEWITAYPDFMDAAVPMAGSPQSTSYDKLLWTSEIEALELDPEWKNGNGTKPMPGGFAVFNEIDSMNVTSPAYRVAITPAGDFPAFLTKTKIEEDGWALTACDAIRQREAIIGLDIPAEYSTTLAELTKRVHAKLLVVVSPEDHMVNPTPAIAFANAMGAPIVRLDTPCGHESLDCVSTGPTVAQFLARPGSVQSQTLTGAAK
jgi:homoserine O-acetyltransferase/O-succinyltransferase